LCLEAIRGPRLQGCCHVGSSTVAALEFHRFF
jgi:hypothetical protein